MAAQEERRRAVAFIRSADQPDADAYYAAFPAEPVLPSGTIQIGQRVVLPAMTIWSLLKSIKEKAKEGQDIVIVSHGIPMGLDIPLSEGNEANLITEVLNKLEQWERGVLRQEHVASICHLSTHQLGSFREDQEKVRKLKLNRVELRACDVGQKGKTLAKLKKFFGCKSICAPKEFDVFGPILLGPIEPGSIERILERYPKAKITGKAPHRFGQYVESGAEIFFHSAAESRQAVSSWIQSHLPGSAKVSGKSFPAHGILPSVGKERMIWAGQPAYRRYLVRV